MAIEATTSATSTSTIPANPAGYTVRKPKQVLESDDFMKLLSVQMANQDPMKPMEDTAFISQMASFSSLSQMNQLTKDFSQLRTDQSKTTANSYIGKTVTVTSEKAESGYVTGEVTGVDLSDSEPLLCIGGNTYPLSSVKYVATASAAGSGTSG